MAVIALRCLVFAGFVAVVAEVADFVLGYAVYARRREVLVPVLGDAARVQVARHLAGFIFQVEWQLVGCGCYA